MDLLEMCMYRLVTLLKLAIYASTYKETLSDVINAYTHNVLAYIDYLTSV